MLKEIVLCDKRGEGLIKVKGGLGENVNILIFILLEVTPKARQPLLLLCLSVTLSRAYKWN